MANKKVTLTIEAEDKATPVMKIFNKSVDNAKNSLDNFSNTTASTKGSNENLTKSIFMGVAIWDALKGAVRKAVTSIKEDIKMYLEDTLSLDLARANIEATGIAWTDAEEKLRSFGTQMVKWGIDSEDAQLSAAKLTKAVGGDLVKGMSLATLAADLTASGFGNLETNTNTLQNVLAGRAMTALKQYRLNLDSTASTAEILNAIQGKVTQTAAEFAQTIPGKIAAVKQTYIELRGEVGKNLVEGFTAAMGSGDKLIESIDGISNAMSFLKPVVVSVISGFRAIIDVFKLFGDAGAIAVSAFKWFIDTIGRKNKEAKENSETLKGAILNLKDSYAQLFIDVEKMEHPMRAIELANNSVIHSNKNLEASAGDMGDGVADANDAAAESYATHEKAVKKLENTYKDLLDNTVIVLAELKEQFDEKMSSISDSIAKTNKEMSKLQNDFAKSQLSETERVADEIVASANRIAEIKDELSKASTDKEKEGLFEKLRTEEKNYASSLAFRNEHAAAISEAERKAGLTDLQRIIEDYNARRALAIEEYNQKIADLQATLLAYQLEQEQEIALHEAKQKRIGELLVAANILYKESSNKRLKQTIDEVSAEIELFNKLTASINAAKSASKSTLGSMSSLGISGLASGGIVQRPTLAVIGEAGPEAVVPLNRASMAGAGIGGNITINITGNEFMGEEGIAERIGNQIMRALKDTVKL